MRTHLTPADIESVIVEETVDFMPGTTITFCTLLLRNGAKVVGINYGAIDASRQDWEMGAQEARKQAIEKVWELEGYLLRERLAPPLVAIDPRSGAVSVVPEAEARLTAIVREFVEKHHVSCPETIHQTDRVIENAYELIEDLCNVVGYYRYLDDQETD